MNDLETRILDLVRSFERKTGNYPKYLIISEINLKKLKDEFGIMDGHYFLSVNEFRRMKIAIHHSKENDFLDVA